MSHPPAAFDSNVATPVPGVGTGRRRWPWVVALLLAAVIAYRWYGGAPVAPTGRTGAPPVPVVAATSRRGDLPIYLTGLGTVTAFNTATVKSRVDGQIVRIAFQEGQLVHEGDLIAEIDPRPFEVQLTQAEGALARDQAQLDDARRSLARFRELLGQKVVSQQEFDDQAAKVGQFEGAVQADRGTIDEAKLNLVYAKVTAPFSGRVGLKQVDVGNVVHASDAAGLVVLAQLQPIAVVFTMPEDNLPAVLGRLHTGEKLPVEVYDRSGQTKLAAGTLLTTDNQIDPATGTARLKAVFDNEDGTLFPNQFVNVRLQLDVRKDAVIVPVAAIQRGPQGTFAYVVKADQTVEARPITVGPTTPADAAIEQGLAADEQVVVDGVDRLRPGSGVQVKPPAASPHA